MKKMKWRTKNERGFYMAIILILQMLLAVLLYTKGNLDAYLGICLPMFVISIFIIGTTKMFGENMIFVMSALMLIQIGMAMQVLIRPQYAAKLVLIEGIALCLGTAMSISVQYLQQRKSRKKQRKFSIWASVFLYLCLIVFGATINGTRAWIKFGSFTFQLTEIIKGIAIFALASIFSEETWSEKEKFKYACLLILFHGIGMAMLRELGTFVVLLLVFFAMMLLFMKEIKYFLVSIASLTGAIAGGIGISYICHDLYERKFSFLLIRYGNFIWNKIYNRMQLFTALDELDPYGIGYQSLTARKAISLGGVLGSRYHIRIPVEESEYIFVSILLNLGYVMAIVVILLFLCHFISGMKMAWKCKDSFRSCVAVGCFSMILFQTLLAMLGTTNAFLLIGVPIPFLSAGGASHALQFAILGYMRNISAEKKLFKRKRKGEWPCKILKRL